jgi:hypothetical protein
MQTKGTRIPQTEVAGVLGPKTVMRGSACDSSADAMAATAAGAERKRKNLQVITSRRKRRIMCKVTREPSEPQQAPPTSRNTRPPCLFPHLVFAEAALLPLSLFLFSIFPFFSIFFSADGRQQELDFVVVPSAGTRFLPRVSGAQLFAAATSFLHSEPALLLQHGCVCRR